MSEATETILKVRHVYEHDVEQFEARVNNALDQILDEGGVVGDIKYASDASTSENPRGGFGALIIYELPSA